MNLFIVSKTVSKDRFRKKNTYNEKKTLTDLDGKMQSTVISFFTFLGRVDFLLLLIWE